jgi:hypothetical protein
MEYIVRALRTERAVERRFDTKARTGIPESKCFSFLWKPKAREVMEMKEVKEDEALFETINSRKGSVFTLLPVVCVEPREGRGAGKPDKRGLMSQIS